MTRCEAVCEIFREQDVLRESRTQARIKYLFMKHGWTAEPMLAAVEEKLGYKFDACDEGPIADDVYRDHVGVHRQKQEGLSYVGATVLNGRLSPEQMHALASLSERVWRWATARDDQAEHRAGEYSECEGAGAGGGDCGAGAARWSRRCSYRGAIACTGTEFCKLAIAETKAFQQVAGGRDGGAAAGVRSADSAACDGMHELAAGRAGLRTSGLRARRSRRTA